ncbi:MAG: dihydrofolate reductase family protein [Hyphomicrobiales bacterium]|nr:dihydrofolate reductase family protein [Hyphomicrobiales bacterium]
MRELAILTFVTLDGVMQAPGSPDEDRSGGFDRGGWAGPYWQEVMDQVQREAMATPYDILFGRKTYELFAAYWPAAGKDGPVGKMMNDATKYVATNTLSEPGWNNARIISGDIPGQIAALKQQDGPLLQVHGSWQLIQTLLAHGLVDEFRLWTFPVIVGAGKRLFDEGAVPTGLTLVKTEPCSNGAVMNIYRRADCPA